MPDTHHIFGPSTLKNRAVCPGWTNDQYSDKTRADEGTLLHAAAETGDYSKLVTDEQRQCVDLVLSYVRPLEAKATRVFKEQRVEILGGKTFGTADRIIYSAANGGHIDVVDFKFGRNPVDDAENNLQGHAYLLGGWDFVRSLGLPVRTGKVHFLLPRLDVVDVAAFEVEKDYSRLGLAIGIVLDRAQEFATTGNEELLNPTAENCLYCGRKAGCQKVINYSLATAKKYAPLELVEEVHSSAITDPAQMAKLLTASRILEKMVDSVKTHAMQLALEQGGTLCDEHGNVVYEIAERAGNRKITDLGLALPVLSKYLDDRELLQVAEVSLPGALKLIASKAKRGEKAKVMGAVEAELAELDAVTSGEPTKYLRRAK